MSIEIGPLRADDKARWAELWRGYLDFYDTTVPPERYDLTWERLMEGRDFAALGARLDGRLVGIAHYLFHPHTWMDDVCYLGDLFTAPEARGQGVGRGLIEAVAEKARERGSPRLYWMTMQDNATARALYDKVASFVGQIRYNHDGVKG